MAIKSINQVQKPTFGIVYGIPKIGKTTFCSTLHKQKCLFVDLENGLTPIRHVKNVVTTDVINSMAQLRREFKDIASFDCDVVVIDSLTQLINICEQDVCQEYSVQNIADIPYGKGTVALKALVMKILAQFKNLNKNVIIIAHSSIVNTPKANSDDIQQHSINAPKQLESEILGLMDLIAFLDFDHIVVDKKIVENPERVAYIGSNLQGAKSGNRYNVNKNKLTLKELAYIIQNQELPNDKNTVISK